MTDDPAMGRLRRVRTSTAGSRSPGFVAPGADATSAIPSVDSAELSPTADNGAPFFMAGIVPLPGARGRAGASQGASQPQRNVQPAGGSPLRVTAYSHAS